MLTDLHIHSDYSDGELCPEELVAFVKQHGVGTVSLTDHDTVSGLDRALAAGREFDVTVIPGVELTTYFNDREVHILGYNIEYRAQKFSSLMNGLREKRFIRIKRMLARLRREGVDIHDKEVFGNENSSSGDIRMSYGRPHIARVLYEKGIVRSFQDAFERYIGNECASYLPKENISTVEGIRLIKEAGGAAVCAHPEDLGSEHIDTFQQNGLDGIEVYCPAHDEMQVYHYEIMAKEKGLIATAGTDMHRENRYEMKLEYLKKSPVCRTDADALFAQVKTKK